MERQVAEHLHALMGGKRSSSVDRPQAAAIDRPPRRVLGLKLLMHCQEFNFVRFVMVALARAVREYTHRMRDRSTTCERVQVIAPTPTVAQIEVVVVVTELYPPHRRSTPPFLVPEVDLVGEARFTLLAGDDQVNHKLANASVLAEVMEVDPTETIKAHP
jgi:hypothetical protein